MQAIKAFGIGGIALLVACVLHKTFFPSGFAYHDDALFERFGTIDTSMFNNFTLPSNTTMMAVWQTGSIDHLGESWVNVIICSQMAFLSAVSLFFAYSRVSFQ